MTLSISHLRELEAKATPAPWTWEDYSGDESDRPDHMVGPPYNVEWFPGSPQRESIITTDGGCYGPKPEDRALIAEMRNALPELLSELTKLRALAHAVRRWADSDEAFRELLHREAYET